MPKLKKYSIRSTSNENQPNKVNMKTDPNKHECKICEICEHSAEWEGCGASNVVDFSPVTDMATVYHMGNHTYWSKIGTEEAKAFIESRQEKHKGTGKAKDAAMLHRKSGPMTQRLLNRMQETGETLDLHKGSLVNKIHFTVKTTTHLMQCLY